MDGQAESHEKGVDPLGKGIDDHAKGVSRSACPYPAGSFEAEQWNDGWERGQRDD